MLSRVCLLSGGLKTSFVPSGAKRFKAGIASRSVARALRAGQVINSRQWMGSKKREEEQEGRGWGILNQGLSRKRRRTG